MTLKLPEPRRTDPASAPALRWGVIGTGIGSQFVASMHGHTPQRTVAIAARNAARTEHVARQLGIQRSYTDNHALIADGEVDAVYIATPHPLHRDLALEAIAAGKHVLIEKPIAMSAAEARDITEAARAAGVLAMEAMWTRYLPQSDILRQILADGLIGQPHLVRADFGPQIPYDPDSRFWSAELGGGGLLDAGIYPINLASLVLGPPTTIVATGTVMPSGLDVTANILITTENNAAALLSTSLVTSLPADAQISGSAGRVEFAAPWFAPTQLKVTVGPWGRQQVATWRHHQPEGPTDGYAFQTTALASYVGEGRVESPLQTHAETVAIMATIDEVRHQLARAGRAAATPPPAPPIEGTTE